MEDILASIRRILSEDEGGAAAAPATAPAAAMTPAAADEEVLTLDTSMLRSQTPDDPTPESAPPNPVLADAQEHSPPDGEGPAPIDASGASPEPLAADMPPIGLVAPEAAAAAAASVGSLLRVIASDRALQVRTGGPTIEDIVRQTLRPLLKDWLDANLPGLVERLVRAEIERVVGRAVN
jgi:cell pole-organizing protein PopZ